MGGAMEERKELEEPEVITYDREELEVETAFTDLISVPF